ncbi:MAG: hypothetical protein JWR10_496, partial [Rubritepida sp.]|nr:hypothetical protein [Rubritepida sp.]
MKTAHILAAGLLVLGVSACADPNDGRPGNPRGTASERALDRSAG